MRKFHFFKRISLVVFISVFLVMSTALVQQVLGCTATRNRFRTWSDCDNNVNPIYDFTGGGFNQVCLGKPFQNYYYATIIFEPDRTCEQIQTGDVAWLVGEWSNENLAEGDTCKVRWNIDCSGCFEGFWDPDDLPGCVGCEGCGQACDRSKDCPNGWGPIEVWKDVCGESGPGDEKCEYACGSDEGCDEHDPDSEWESGNKYCDENNPCVMKIEVYTCDGSCNFGGYNRTEPAPFGQVCQENSPGNARFVEWYCDEEWKCSSFRGDGHYGTGGERRDYLCRGMCDGVGNCDVAVFCRNCNLDKTTPDDYEPKCPGHSYPSSANQYRDYYCSAGECTCSVDYDSNIIIAAARCLDINRNGDIDIRDIAAVAKAFAAELITDPEDPRYGGYWHTTPCTYCPHDPLLDIDDNGKIDIRDIASVARKFGCNTDGCWPVATPAYPWCGD